MYPASDCSRYSLAAAVLILLLLVLWMGIRGCRSAGGARPFGVRVGSLIWKWLARLAKCAVGLVLLAVLIGAGWIVWTEWQAREIEKQALTKWAQIGRPMADLERELKPVEENGSLKQLTQELGPFGVRTLYKRPGGVDQIELPEKISELLCPRPARDQLKSPVPKLAYLEAHADELTRLYQGILRREPPVWALDFPNKGWLGVPDYLALRKISQLIAADAMSRMANGDPGGAALAIEAGLKMSQNLGEQPILVSSMIRVAIKGMFTEKSVWLPEDPTAWERLAKDAKTTREQLLKTFQAEAWWASRVASTEPSSLSCASDRCQPLPQWASNLFVHPFIRLQTAQNSEILAENVRVMRDWPQGRLGTDELEKACSTDHSTVFTPNYIRAALRVNLSLLLCEQVEMIRFARARMQEGKIQAGHPSVVIPGATWEMTGDLTTNSATLKLSPIPKWAVHNDVAGADFFLLPLDGSKPWQFAPAPERK